MYLFSAKNVEKFGLTLYTLDVSCKAYCMFWNYTVSNALEQQQNRCFNDKQLHKYDAVKSDKSLYSVLKLERGRVTLCMQDVSCETYFLSWSYTLSDVLAQWQNRSFNGKQLHKYDANETEKSVLKLEKFSVTLCMQDISC